MTEATPLTFTDLLERARGTPQREFAANVGAPVLVATGTLALRVLQGSGPRSTGVIELPAAQTIAERLRNDPHLARIFLVRRVDGGPGPLRVGRTGDNDIAIDDSSLSRHHATMEVASGAVMVVDLGSRNGTFVREERLVPGAAIAANSEDILRFGRVSLQLYEPAALWEALRSCL